MMKSIQKRERSLAVVTEGNLDNKLSLKNAANAEELDESCLYGCVKKNQNIVYEVDTAASDNVYPYSQLKQ